jgi:type VI secretion system protein ImpA
MGLFKKSKPTAPEAQPIRLSHVVEIQRLLVDISPEAPSGGEDLSGDPAYIDLEIKIQGTPEREIGGKIVQEAKEANWPEIQTAAFGLLTRTHDLRAAMFLIRAMLHTHGLAGLYTGLELLNGFIEGYWNTLYPQLDPTDNDDPTERINILWALGEGPEIIDPLMKVSLFSPNPALRIALRNIHIATGKIAAQDEDGNSLNSLPMIEEALKDCDAKDLESTREAISQSMVSLGRLEHLVEEKVGTAQAPDFKKMMSMLGEMAAFFDNHLPKRPPPRQSKRNRQQAAIHADNAGSKVPAAADPMQTDGSMETITSRKDVLYLLDQICAYYEQHEPASPVPLLLKRAHQLVEKNFVEIVQDLAPQAADQIKSIFGDYPNDTS